MIPVVLSCRAYKVADEGLKASVFLRAAVIVCMSLTPTTPLIALSSIDLQTASATVLTWIGGKLSRLARDSAEEGKSCCIRV